MIQTGKKYDLEERTAKFGESVILLCKRISQNSLAKPIINQLVRSATSIGANYMEANGASSRKDFINNRTYAFAVILNLIQDLRSIKSRF